MAVSDPSAEPDLIEQARRVPQTNTKKHFEHNEWHIDGVLYMENQMFWRMFHVGESATYICKGVTMDSKEGDVFPRLQKKLEFIENPDLAHLDCLVPVHPLRVTVPEAHSNDEVVKCYVRMPLYVSTANDLPLPCTESPL